MNPINKILKKAKSQGMNLTLSPRPNTMAKVFHKTTLNFHQKTQSAK